MDERNALTLEAPGLPQLKVEDISSDPQTTEVEILPKKAEEQDTLGDVRNDYEQIP